MVSYVFVVYVYAMVGFVIDFLGDFVGRVFCLSRPVPGGSLTSK